MNCREQLSNVHVLGVCVCMSVGVCVCYLCVFRILLVNILHLSFTITK